MPKVNGNIEGIRKSTLDEIAALYDAVFEPDDFLPQELLIALCGYSASLNREIALYITRDGEVADILIGWYDHVDMPDLRLRRGTERLSMIRCVHTHPSSSGQLSDVDLSALRSLRFDAMCAIGTAQDGHPTSAQCAFLNAASSDSFVLSPVVSAIRLPQKEWLQAIEAADIACQTKLPEVCPETEKAVLVGIESEESLDELQELAKTAGAVCVLRVLQKRPKPDSGFCIGRGKAEELSLQAQAADADIVIFDEELSAVTQRNLEEILHLKVIDRTMLILDIFAARASSREGKLQVEMAQLKYRSAHLMGQGIAMSRLAGGIGTRGPGESKLEVNRRRIRERIDALEKQLDQVQSQRSLRRKSRTKNGIPVVALIGYTNAGKSTLFNRLTGAGVYAENQLFATLDSVSRPVTLPRGAKVLFVDTVGFIRKLPHELIQAFRSTLEETVMADIQIIVCDGKDPQMDSHYQTVLEVLQGLGADHSKRIVVLNKCDDEEALSKLSGDMLPISAQTGLGLNDFLSHLENKLNNGLQEVRLLIPFEKYGLLHRLYASGRTLTTENTEEGVLAVCTLDKATIQSLCLEGVKLQNSAQ